MLARLDREGYLRRDEDSGRYRLGLRLVALARGALRELGFREGAEPVLYRVASEAGLAAGIGVLQSGRVLVVDRVEAPESRDAGLARNRPREQREVGRELPAHTTALGKVLLAWLPRPELWGYIENRLLVRRTAATIVSRDRLLVELKQIRRRGYALADGEHDLAVRALSAPIFDYMGVVRAALSLNGAPSAPAWRDPRRLAACVIAAARDIAGSARFPWNSA